MSLFERESEVFFHTYKRFPLEIERGEGMYLITKDGNRYLDMFSGLGVNALGYGHPAILKAIREQSEKYIHTSNYYLQEPQIRLAEMLTQHGNVRRVFFSNSGTESIEGAIKLARKWGSTRNKTEIISFSNAFHGRTFGALSLMDNAKYKAGYGPFLSGCTIIEFNNINQLRSAVSESTAAIILESIQGEGGIHPVSEEFTRELMSLKQQFGFLIIADEIQAGIGRTGKLFAYSNFSLLPDIIAVAKPLGGGLPLGAVLGNETVAEVFSAGVHGTTFGGNPVACAAGIATLTEILENGLMNNAQTMGALLKSELLRLQDDFPALIKEVRGIGLMIGAELTREGEPVVTAMRERNILINCTAGSTLRLLPPLIIEQPHIEQTIYSLREIFTTL